MPEAPTPARDPAATGGLPSPSAAASRRGRRAAATREDVLALVMHRYLRGLRVDVQAIAAELGLGRTTIYRWFGSREELIGEVVVRAAEPVLAEARSGARGEGAEALLDTFDRFNRSIAASTALRRFIEREREAALRVITSSGGQVQPRIVAMITALIAAEVSAGAYEPPLEPATLAYAIVRLAEAFLYNDAAVGIRGDVDRLREVEAAMLGLKTARTRHPRRR
ncbi:MAG: TetR/AcrR family transcriptional regulator [Actinobacteria bacterium]|nr:MAG: TetR/AcrR family transcriptional regulator [Actinomycetota bacterium]